ncbi:MAG: hypothetical protein A3B23_02845 [Candidatus Colwellbacteria bacterium RIFCSPLOWO2_01_FULL_48_10]|uniref:Uncharacterized protein n=1 Tax=Candidatus Colwellbacteria bacterium RIFCSPLOWO2_01_FULL_48_10 TaxID=1797690 RepID=A0A1G1Z5B4_9BACT|nr:MAG: hypothetical protein A3B23_02845 [Candidatus Colwellbacteria bacterium RIFCSPLOWO2_01_FULL_48_10]
MNDKNLLGWKAMQSVFAKKIGVIIKGRVYERALGALLQLDPQYAPAITDIFMRAIYLKPRGGKSLKLRDADATYSLVEAILKRLEDHLNDSKRYADVYLRHAPVGQFQISPTMRVLFKIYEEILHEKAEAKMLPDSFLPPETHSAALAMDRHAATAYS